MLPSATNQVWSVDPRLGCLMAPDHTLQCHLDAFLPGQSWSTQIVGTTSDADCSTSVLLIVGANAVNEPPSDG